MPNWLQFIVDVLNGLFVELGGPVLVSLLGSLLVSVPTFLIGLLFGAIFGIQVFLLIGGIDCIPRYKQVLAFLLIPSWHFAVGLFFLPTEWIYTLPWGAALFGWGVSAMRLGAMRAEDWREVP